MSDFFEQELPTGRLQVQVEQAKIALNDLMGFAARANAKRGFLFLSKVLGKHYPVSPRRMREIHEAMAADIADDLPEPVVFIAMAETAIGLGQGVFEAYQRRVPDKTLLFIHSTRYAVDETNLIEFEEAHSHAPRQFLHMPDKPEFRQHMLQAKSIVIVDDEASTGNTFLNLSNVIRRFNPALERLHLAVITNFMGSAATAALSQRFALNVTMGACLSGAYEFTHSRPIAPSAIAQRCAAPGAIPVSSCFGRMGTDQAWQCEASSIARILDELPKSASVLVLGTGEFMHAPFVLATALEQRGFEVRVQASTRSPILVWGAVSSSLNFSDNYGEGITNYLYNVADRSYDKIFLCHETPMNPALAEAARVIGAECLYFTDGGKFEKISLC